MARSHGKTIVGERATNAGSPPRNNEIEGRKRCVTHPGFVDRAFSWPALKRLGSKLEA
ncbi:hypothetical protein CK203_060889 [Vitis vinifera]|uniref:Uncharacterized protein n=1 Tax=Vitis vinifera TaxID=29760 RepID=A0A438GD03_VITVI|nr:hypothetical protein CK203_060889 [Vitis vinifera]